MSEDKLIVSGGSNDFRGSVVKALIRGGIGLISLFKIGMVKVLRIFNS
jgi:hypothetical protein